MKTISYKIVVCTLAVLGLVACHKYNPIKPDEGVKAEDRWQKTHTIAQFLDQFMTEEGDIQNYPPRSASFDKTNKNLGLFSVNMVKSETPVVIVGRIVSEDRGGNVYKTLYIQDVDFPEQGLKISVDAGSLSGVYALGQVIAIRCNDLAVGKYARMPQIGVPYFNDAKEGEDRAYKVGWEVGRIPVAIFREHVQLIGKPEPSKIVVHTMTIAEIKAIADDFRAISRLTSRLVKIEGVHFVPKTWAQNGGFDDLSGTFDCAYHLSNTIAPTTDEHKGYPQARCFTTDAGENPSEANTLAIGTSEYAKFACSPIPTEEYVGSVQGVVSYYYDNGNYSKVPDKVWSLVINGLEDLKLESVDGKWVTDSCYYTKY